MSKVGFERKRYLLLRSGAVCATILFCLLLSGCWDEVNLEDVSYISALGVDYKDGKFEFYTQLINFSSIAKTDAASTPDQQKVWIGKAEGESVLLAFFNLSGKAYSTLNMEHLKTIVIHRRALSHLEDLLDGLNRHRTSRYTSWLYGTDIPIEKLFNTDNFFDQSPLHSLLYMPVPHERQYSYLYPLKMQTAVRSLREPGMATLMPVLKQNKSTWQHGEERMSTQTISGMFVFKNFKYYGYLSERDAPGLRWLDPNFERVMLKAQGDGSGMATISVRKSNSRLETVWSDGEPSFRLAVKLKGHVVEMDGQITKEQINDLIEETVANEIHAVFQKGLQKKMDLLGLEHHLYRYHFRKWKSIPNRREWIPEKGQLTVDVKFQLQHSGKFEISNATDS